MRAQQCRSWTNENAGYISNTGESHPAMEEGRDGGPQQEDPGPHEGGAAGTQQCKGTLDSDRENAG